MGDGRKEALRVEFDRQVKLEFHGARISSDGGLLLYRELDEVLGLTERAEQVLKDTRTGKNTQHTFDGVASASGVWSVNSLRQFSAERRVARWRIGQNDRTKIRWPKRAVAGVCPKQREL